MASDFYDPAANAKYVSDGDTCYADDLNKVNNATNAGFEQVEDEVDSALALAIENSGLSKEWSANDQGDLPSNPVGDPPNTTDYSSKANALETKDWASAADGSFAAGDTIHLADGTTELHPSAKTSAAHAETKADESAASAVTAEGHADDAAASAAEAIATNTISAGDEISVVKTGTDPYDYEVSLDPDTKTYIHVYRNSSQVIMNLTETPIVCNAELSDLLGEYNNSNGIFTPANDGVYSITCTIRCANVTWPTGSYAYLILRVGGAAQAMGPFVYPNAPAYTAAASCTLSKIVSLFASDTVTISLYHNRGASVSTLSSLYDVYLTIARLA